MSYRREKQFNRDRERMADYVARKTGYANANEHEAHDWSAGSDKYANPPAVNENGHGVRRSHGRKPFPKKEKAGPSEDPATKYVATEASPPSDELRYNVPTLTGMVPNRDYGLYNHTAEGYLNMLEQSHNKMKALDGRIVDTLPESVYIHNMTQLYHLHVQRIAHETRQSATWSESEEDLKIKEMEELLDSSSVLIPAEVHDWLKGVGTFQDKTGYCYAPNVPKIVVPQKAREGSDGGDFGKPDGDSHNAYETSISPLVTRRAVEALLTNAPVNGRIVHTPLPDTLTPQDGHPNENLLGYQPELRPLSAEALDNYAGAEDGWPTHGIMARIGYNPILWSKQTAAFAVLEPRMKFIRGMPPLHSGSLSVYASIIFERAGNTGILRKEGGYLESAADLDPASIAGAAIKTYRRRRVTTAPGCCYLSAANAPLPNWLAGCNNSYNMVGPFAPTYGAVDVALNRRRFKRELQDDRYDKIREEIARLTTIKIN